MNKRVISRIDIKNNTLVKGVQLEGLRTLGNPKKYADYYYDNGVDEIFLMDVVASLYERNNIGTIVKEIASDVFVPITVGGGLRSLQDIGDMLKSGADKTAINTSGLKNPEFLVNAVKEFGSSTIVANVEVVRKGEGSYECFYDNGREPANISLTRWLHDLISIGVGEIVITSVQDDGMGHGFDLNILSAIPSNLQIPLIVHGGIGSLSHVQALSENDKIDGFAISSALHYGAKSYVFENTNNEGNYAYLNSGRVPLNIDPFSVKDVKNILCEK